MIRVDTQLLQQRRFVLESRVCLSGSHLASERGRGGRVGDEHGPSVMACVLGHVGHLLASLVASAASIVKLLEVLVLTRIAPVILVVTGPFLSPALPVSHPH